MSIQPLGCRMHDHVSAKLEWLKVEGGEEGIVYDRGDRRHTRRDGYRLCAAFELCEHIFERMTCRVATTRVIVSGRDTYIAKAEIGSLIERCADRAVFGVGVSGVVNCFRLELH